MLVEHEKREMGFYRINAPHDPVSRSGRRNILNLPISDEYCQMTTIVLSPSLSAL